MKTLMGVVVGTKMDKTAVVKVDRPWRHPVYQKTVKRSKRYLVDDPQRKAQEGRVVVIMEGKPVSKHKTWMVKEVR